jgi:benzoate-CoA ligase
MVLAILKQLPFSGKIENHPGVLFNATDYFIDRNIRQGRGHQIAIYTRFRNYTYNDIQKMVNKTANALINLGIRIEDRVLILLLDIPQFYAIFWGAIKIGGIPVPVNTMMMPEDYEYYLNDSRARVLVVSEELLPVINQIRGDLLYLRDLIVISEKDGARIPFRQKYKRSPSTIKPAATMVDDAAFWLYSSGSTGSPKGAVHSQKDMVVTSEAYAGGILNLKPLFCLWPWQYHVFPPGSRGIGCSEPGEPHPGRGLFSFKGIQAHGFLRRTHTLRKNAGIHRYSGSGSRN